MIELKNIEDCEITSHSDIYEKFSHNRIIFLSEDITKKTGSIFSAFLLYYNSQSATKPIKIFINSEGGDATALLNIYDVLQMIKAPVETICIGKAYSSAAIILSAGAKGKRFATKNAHLMIHGLQIEMDMGTNYDKIDTELKQLEADNRLLMNILARHTGKHYKTLEKDCKRDLFLDPGMAMEYGLIDHII